MATRFFPSRVTGIRRELCVVVSFVVVSRTQCCVAGSVVIVCLPERNHELSRMACCWLVGRKRVKPGQHQTKRRFGVASAKLHIPLLFVLPLSPVGSPNDSSRR